MSEPEQLPRARAELERGMEQGLHVGANLQVSLAGAPVSPVVLGLAAPGVPMAVDTLMPWFSCTKLVTAVAVMQQWERGELELDDPVHSHIRDFGGAGRDGITIRHLLTHTAGLRPADGPPASMRTESWDEAVARVVATEPEQGWVPGRRAGYHLRGTFFLLGEIVRLLDGRPFDQYVRDEIFLPLGMTDSWLAMAPEQARAYGSRLGVMYDTSGRVRADGPRPFSAFQAENGAYDVDDAYDAYVRCVPGASGVGPMGDLVRIAELLLANGRLLDQQLLLPQTVAAMTARHRVDLQDETFGARIDWGLGVMVNSWHYQQRPAPYGYGDHASARTFGHGGVQSSLCFADPEAGLAVALVCNGMPGEAANHRRTQPVVTALYEDLGLSSPTTATDG